MFCHRRTKWNEGKIEYRRPTLRSWILVRMKWQFWVVAEWANLPYPQQNPTKNQFIIVTEVYWHETQKSLTRTPKQQLRLLTDFFRESATHSRKLLRNNNKYLELFWVQADTAISEASITTSLECQEGINPERDLRKKYLLFQIQLQLWVSSLDGKNGIFLTEILQIHPFCFSSNRQILWQILEFCKNILL